MGINKHQSPFSALLLEKEKMKTLTMSLLKLTVKVILLCYLSSRSCHLHKEENTRYTARAQCSTYESDLSDDEEEEDDDDS